MKTLMMTMLLTLKNVFAQTIEVRVFNKSLSKYSLSSQQASRIAMAAVQKLNTQGYKAKFIQDAETRNSSFDLPNSVNLWIGHNLEPFSFGTVYSCLVKIIRNDSMGRTVYGDQVYRAAETSFNVLSKNKAKKCTQFIINAVKQKL